MISPDTRHAHEWCTYIHAGKTLRNLQKSWELGGLEACNPSTLEDRSGVGGGEHSPGLYIESIYIQASQGHTGKPISKQLTNKRKKTNEGRAGTWAG